MPTLNFIYHLKRPDKLVLITDSMCATGCGDGLYSFGGETILVKDGSAHTADGILAGSTLLLFNGIKNLMNFVGIRFEEAVRFATINPAKAIGIDHICGSIEQGKRADLLLINDTLEIHLTICGGRIVYDPGKLNQTRG